MRKALVERAAKEPSSFVFVEFNAWLYQGYDDARAALMEVIASALAEETEKRETGVDKAKAFLRRVKWLRLDNAPCAGGDGARRDLQSTIPVAIVAVLKL